MKGLKYLLGPISMDADLTWVPSPKRYNFTEPLISLRLMMTELRLKVTKNQYKDFAMLLHSLNNMTLAARYVFKSHLHFKLLFIVCRYRKYKSEFRLENVTSYRGRGDEERRELYRRLWQFAGQCILEEDVRPRLRMWDWRHIREHIRRCKEYRDAYKDKLLGTVTKDNEERLQGDGGEAGGHQEEARGRGRQVNTCLSLVNTDHVT